MASKKVKPAKKGSGKKLKDGKIWPNIFAIPAEHDTIVQHLQPVMKVIVIKSMYSVTGAVQIQLMQYQMWIVTLVGVQN